MESIIDEMETKLNSLTRYTEVDHISPFYRPGLSSMYSMLKLVKQPLKDQLRKEIYVENQAKRKPEALGNIRYTLQP